MLPVYFNYVFFILKGVGYFSIVDENFVSQEDVVNK